MTHTITARNVNSAFNDGFWLLRLSGIKEDSRNGPVVVAPGPVVTTYLVPTERVLFHAGRDANPVFHLLESIWMLAGRDSVDWVLPFNSRFSEYAESDGRVHGAYGRRWRQHWRFDQIKKVISILNEDPNSRQAVIQMWDPENDLGVKVKDKPCNTAIYFDLRGGVLNMTVTNRSNDIVWGAYGANAVHMSMLQEFIAGAVSAKVGVYRQFSNNFHAYTNHGPVADWLIDPPAIDDRYLHGGAEVMPLVDSGRGEVHLDFLEDCEQMTGRSSTDLHSVAFRTNFFNEIVEPLRRVYVARKMGFGVEKFLVDLPPQNDWVIAFKEWMERRDGSK